MDIFVINLKRRKDRRVFMEKQLDKYGLTATFIEAVDGKELNVEMKLLYDEDLALRKNKKKLSEGELGCALSHRLIYQKMVEQNIPVALIFEDDISFDERLVSLVHNESLLNSTAWTWLQIDYSLINLISWFKSAIPQIKKNPLFVIYVCVKLPYITILAMFEKIMNYLIKTSDPKILYMPRPVYFAGCYLLKNTGAHRLLDLTTPVRYPADRLPNQARLQKGFVMKVVFPRIVEQQWNTFNSDIG